MNQVQRQVPSSTVLQRYWLLWSIVSFRVSLVIPHLGGRGSPAVLTLSQRQRWHQVEVSFHLKKEAGVQTCQDPVVAEVPEFTILAQLGFLRLSYDCDR